MWRGWIKTQGIRAVARQLEVAPETVRLWVSEGRNPKDETKKRLVDLAQGEFGFADFFK